MVLIMIIFMQRKKNRNHYIHDKNNNKFKEIFKSLYYFIKIDYYKYKFCIKYLTNF